MGLTSCKVDDLEAVLFGQGLQELVVGDQAARDCRLAGELTGALGLFEDVPELFLVNEAKVDQHLADAAAAAARPAALGDMPGGGGGRRLLGRGLAIAGRFRGRFRRHGLAGRRRLRFARHGFAGRRCHPGLAMGTFGFLGGVGSFGVAMMKDPRSPRP